MFISDILNFKKGSVISIVGAGGKTSLMLNLSEELRLITKFYQQLLQRYTILIKYTTILYALEKKIAIYMITLNKMVYMYMVNV